MRYFLFMLFSGCTLCTPQAEDCPETMVYEVGVSLLNPADTILTGDTLWSEIKLSKTLIDKNAGIENTFLPDDMPTTFYFLHRIDSTAEQGGRFKIEVIDRIGSHIYAPLSFGYDRFILRYELKRDSYHFKTGFVLNEPGLFTFQIAVSRNLLRKRTKNCGNSLVEWHFTQSAKKTNFEYLENNPLPFWKDYKKEHWDWLGSMCFYVKRR
jgi:hypothetical protein